MPEDQALNVQLEIPAETVRGAYVFATLTVRNTSQMRLTVSSRLNLFEGDVRILLTSPDTKTKGVQGIVMVDSFLRQKELAPGEAIEGQLGLFFTNLDFTFDQPGAYRLQAEYDPGGLAEMVRSAEERLSVHPATTQEERELQALTMNASVGRSFALGTAERNPDAIDKLEEIAARFKDLTGIAARLVLANEAGPDHGFKEVFAAHDPVSLTRLACAVMPPPAVMGEQPLLRGLRSFLDEDSADSQVISDAHKILQDHAL